MNSVLLTISLLISCPESTFDVIEKHAEMTYTTAPRLISKEILRRIMEDANLDTPLWWQRLEIDELVDECFVIECNTSVGESSIA